MLVRLVSWQVSWVRLVGLQWWFDGFDEFLGIGSFVGEVRFVKMKWCIIVSFNRSHSYSSILNC